MGAAAHEASERRVYDITEVQEFLGTSRNHAYEMAREGAFPSLRLGRRIVIPRHAFDEWLRTVSQPESIT